MKVYTREHQTVYCEPTVQGHVLRGETAVDL